MTRARTDSGGEISVRATGVPSLVVDQAELGRSIGNRGICRYVAPEWIWCRRSMGDEKVGIRRCGGGQAIVKRVF